MRRVEDMPVEELRAIVAGAVDVLWPGGDPDAEWEVETIELVAEVFDGAGLRPTARHVVAMDEPREPEGD